MWTLLIDYSGRGLSRNSDEESHQCESTVKDLLHHLVGGSPPPETVALKDGLKGSGRGTSNGFALHTTKNGRNHHTQPFQTGKVLWQMSCFFFFYPFLSAGNYSCSGYYPVLWLTQCLPMHCWSNTRHEARALQLGPHTNSKSINWTSLTPSKATCSVKGHAAHAGSGSKNGRLNSTCQE